MSGDVPDDFKKSVDHVNTALSPGIKKPFKEYVRDQVENVERQMIARALDESGGNVTQAAKKMGLSRKGLQLKMSKYHLRKESK